MKIFLMTASAFALLTGIACADDTAISNVYNGGQSNTGSILQVGNGANSSAYLYQGFYAGLGYGAATPVLAEDGSFHLSIDGPAETNFSGTCQLTGDHGVETIDLSGSPPFERILAGRRLSCQLRQDSQEGQLSVVVRHGGSVSRSTTQGQGGVITLSLS